MNRVEFLEILKDYLKKDFHEDEVNDILRDYEEYFVNGTIEGKSDMEIIGSLGSPKSIAHEMVAQIKDNDESELSKKDILFDKIEDIKIKMKKRFNKLKNYISRKLTPDLDENGNSLSRKAIKIVLVILSLFLIMPASMFIFFMLSYLMTLIGSIATYIFALPFIVKLTQIIPQIGVFSIFASMAFIGFQIILWQIFILIARLGKQVFKNYIHWLKTRGIYINAIKKRETLKKDDLEYSDGLEYSQKVDLTKGDGLDE